LAAKSAGAALEQLNDKLNASFNGQYLFAGVNTDVRPVAPNPHDPASAGRAAVDMSFLAQFGMTQSDPNLESIPAAAVDAWIDGSFSTLFEDAGWRTNFSGASQKVIQSRVSMSEVVASSVSSDSTAFRDVTRALSLVGQSGIDNMSRSAADRLMDRAMNILGSGQQAVTSMQADMGSVQTRVSDATERLTIQSQSLAKSIGSIEDVDPYEVSVRLNNLQTQIETSYALTSRISQLSLLKFL
jgi:flagellar hook-associated protein 3 FlgL